MTHYCFLALLAGLFCDDGFLPLTLLHSAVGCVIVSCAGGAAAKVNISLQKHLQTITNLYELAMS